MRADRFLAQKDATLREQAALLARLVGLLGETTSIGEELLLRATIERAASECVRCAVAGKNRRLRAAEHAVEDDQAERRFR